MWTWSLGHVLFIHSLKQVPPVGLGRRLTASLDVSVCVKNWNGWNVASAINRDRLQLALTSLMNIHERQFTSVLRTKNRIFFFFFSNWEIEFLNDQHPKWSDLGHLRPDICISSCCHLHKIFFVFFFFSEKNAISARSVTPVRCTFSEKPWDVWMGSLFKWSLNEWAPRGRWKVARVSVDQTNRQLIFSLKKKRKNLNFGFKASFNQLNFWWAHLHISSVGAPAGG